MQGMEADATTLGIVNGIGQQMIQIHQHGSHHQQIGPPPLTTKAAGSDRDGNKKMQDQMNSFTAPAKKLSGSKTYSAHW